MSGQFLQNFEIMKIDYKEAMEIIVKNHYLHRRCPASFCFGLFYKKEIVGVITYGTPSSAPLRKGICGEEESMNVIELTRLWIRDDIPTNGESFLIGNTIRKVNKEIVVSFADTDKDHLGIIYQASNWIYTGLSAKRTNWSISGLNNHCQTIADKYSAKEILEKFGESFSLVPRSRKHRYVYFNAKSKKRKKELIAKLRYPILSYPKFKEAVTPK